MSGHWPPEWEDPEGEFPEGAGELDTEAEARLSEVAAYLASVPVPALPDAFEARISAALAAEAAARADHSAPANGSRKLEASRTQAHVGRHRGSGGPRRGFRLRPAMVAVAAAACLLLAGLGYGLSLVPATTESSSVASGSSSASSAAGAGTAAGAERPAAAASSAAASSSTESSAASSAAAGPNAGAGSSFVVTASGTRYQQATLAEQVHAKLTANGEQPSPAASASAASASVAPSSALRGCVLHLTGNVLPRLVDRATYQGEPAYVIASSSRVWAVGLGCTAAKPELFASVPLAG